MTGTQPSPHHRTATSRIRRSPLAVRVLKVLLGVLVILGLVPGSHELLENLVHLAHDGHLAHSEVHEFVADSEQCGPDTEHDCTPLSHHCGCCVSLAALPDLPDLVVLPTLKTTDALFHPHAGAGPPMRTLEPPYRPPIA